MSHLTQNSLFRRRSSQPFSWLSMKLLQEILNSMHANVW